MTSVSVLIYQIKITLNQSDPNVWRRIEVPFNISFLQLHYCIQEAMGWENCHLFQFKVKPIPLSKAEQAKKATDLRKISLTDIDDSQLSKMIKFISLQDIIITMPLYYFERELVDIYDDEENKEEGECQDNKNEFESDESLVNLQKNNNDDDDDDDDYDGDFRADRTLINKFLKAEKDKLTYEYDFGNGWEHDIVLEKILQAQPDLAYPRLTAGECACPFEDCGGIWGYYEMVKAINDPKHPNHDDMVEWIGENEWDVKEFDLPKEGVVLNTWTT